MNNKIDNLRFLVTTEMQISNWKILFSKYLDFLIWHFLNFGFNINIYFNYDIIIFLGLKYNKQRTDYIFIYTAIIDSLIFGKIIPLENVFPYH